MKHFLWGLGFVVLFGLGFLVYSGTACVGCNPTGLVVGGNEMVSEKKSVFGSLSAREFNDKLGEEGVVLIDIRTLEEFDEGRIDGALNIDFYSSSFREKIDSLDKNNVYVIYCKTGSRSSVAIQLMKSLGFSEVYELRSGITSWASSGLPIKS